MSFLEALSPQLYAVYQRVRTLDWSGLFKHNKLVRKALSSESYRAELLKYSSFFIDSIVDDGFCERKNDVIKTSLENRFAAHLPLFFLRSSIRPLHPSNLHPAPTHPES